MTEVDALYRRRRYLLEQISKAADEINRIDDRLAYLISPASHVDLPTVESKALIRPEPIIMAGNPRN